MHFEIRQNIPAYLADLNHWLAETRDDPLEEMSNFFTERVSTYEEHMARWNEAYRSMAERIPDNCGSLLDLGCGTGLELNAILKRFPGLHVPASTFANRCSRCSGKNTRARCSLCAVRIISRRSLAWRPSTLRYRLKACITFSPLRRKGCSESCIRP